MAEARNALAVRMRTQLCDRVGQALAAEPPVQAAVYLFGSWATGEFDGQSDVDLLVLAPDRASAQEAAQRLMTIADDVLALSHEEWTRRLAAGSPFYTRLAGERELLLDACGGGP